MATNLIAAFAIRSCTLKKLTLQARSENALRWLLHRLRCVGLLDCKNCPVESQRKFFPHSRKQHRGQQCNGIDQRLRCNGEVKWGATQALTVPKNDPKNFTDGNDLQVAFPTHYLTFQRRYTRSRFYGCIWSFAPSDFSRSGGLTWTRTPALC